MMGRIAVMDNNFCRWWRRHMDNVIAALLAVVVCGAAYLTFFDTNNPRVLESAVLGADGHPQRQFRAGDNLYVYRHFCVDRVVSGDVDVEIMSKNTGAFWYISTRATGARKGCSKRTSVNKLPQNLLPGVYVFKAKAHFNVNPLRVVIYELPEVEFEVIP